ncbi:MAG: hypothetical protein EBZ62_00300 [Sphingobacteriia bacterium]|nr:hypothetical protein [Sphingobacteriia bacterium]
MPIPDKHTDEDKQKFISRCMSDEVMKKEYPDTKQRAAICISQTKKHKSKSDLLNDVQDNVLANNCDWDDEWDEFIWEIEAGVIYDEEDKIIAAEKNGKKVTLNKPFRTPDGPKKFSVYVKNDKGNVVKVNFGDPNMTIKKNIPERRKSFRARMRCDSPGPRWKSRYWACKSW